jgi:hypothetical protein
MSEDEQRRPTLGDRFGKRSSASGLAATGNLPTVPEAAHQPSITQQMTGSLKEKPISHLLQLADHYEATGQLQIGGFQYTVTIQFGLGKPIHAFSPFNKGTEAILELYTWQDGKISFTEGIQPETPSVEENAPQILTLGDEYLRNMDFLQKLDITELSFLLRSPGKLSDQELEKILLGGAPINMKMQKEFYGNIYGTLNIRDIAEKMNLSQSRWMATVANMLKLGLLLTPDGRSLEETGFDAPVKAPAKPNQQELKAMVAHDLNDAHRYDSLALTSTHTVAPPGSWSPDGQKSSGSPGENGHAPLMPPVAVFQHPPPPPPMPASGFGAAPPAVPHTPPPSQPREAQQSDWLRPSSDVTTSTFPMVPDPQNSFAMPPAMPGIPGIASAPSGSAAASSGIPSISAAPFGQSVEPATPPPTPFTAASQKSFHLGIPNEIVFFDNSIPKRTLTSLNRIETGILTHDALLFFLEREFSRAFRFSNCFTFMSFCITISATGWPVMPTESIALLMQALNQMRRDVDSFGHFGERGFGLILPNVDSAQACGLVDRISQTLPQAVPQLSQYAPILHFGIASVPTDATDIDGLVAGAQRAMIEAANRNVTRVRFDELS